MTVLAMGIATSCVLFFGPLLSTERHDLMDKWIAKLMSVILPRGSCPLMFRFFPYNLFVGGPVKLCRMVSRVVDEWVMMRRAHCHPTKWIRQMLRTDARLFTFDSHAYIKIADAMFSKLIMGDRIAMIC